MTSTTPLITVIAVVVQWLKSLPVMEQWLLVAFVFFATFFTNAAVRRQRSWVDVPVLGKQGVLSSYLSALQHTIWSRDVLREGYEKYRDRGGLFKAADFQGFPVFVAGPEIIDELMRLPDEVLSTEDAIKDILQADYLFRSNMFTNPYQVPVVRHTLTRNLSTLFPDLMDEVHSCFDDLIPTTDEWVPVKAHSTFMEMICRLSNRAFVGFPLCRNREWIDINLKYTIDMVMAGLIIRHFPTFLKKLAGKCLTSVNSRYRAAYKHLAPIIEERRKMLLESSGSLGESLPNDFLTWLMQAAVGEEQTTEMLVHRILLVNFGAIHTSSTCFTWVIYFLASYPEYVTPLREEIESIIELEGWTKMAMTRCWKLDSFVKETMRLKPMGSVGVTRIARKDISLTNGTVIKQGTTVYTCLEALQRDPLVYGSDAHKFNGFRFSDLRMGEEHEENKHQVVFSNSEFVVFGGGRHTCPGRFFATNEIKSLAAHIISNYDIKFADPRLKHGELPSETWLGPACIPNLKTEILFRRRKGTII